MTVRRKMLALALLCTFGVAAASSQQSLPSPRLELKPPSLEPTLKVSPSPKVETQKSYPGSPDYMYLHRTIRSRLRPYARRHKTNLFECLPSALRKRSADRARPLLGCCGCTRTSLIASLTAAPGPEQYLPRR
jgi:hypothetical protein